MRIKPLLMALVLAITVLLVACTAPAEPSSQAWVEVSCDDFYNNNHISQMLEVQAGEAFTVKLCSNPTTGFNWLEDAQISNPAVIEQENYEFVGPETEPPPPGTPGQSVWTFKALKEGSSTIYLKYSRPWEGGEKQEWTCTVEVVVK